MATKKSKNVKSTPVRSSAKSTPTPTPQRSVKTNRKLNPIIMPDIEIIPYDNPESFTLAFVNLVFGQFKVKNLYIRLFPQDDGEIAVLCFPAEHGSDDKWYSTCNPITKEFRQTLNDAVIEKYIEITGEVVDY